MRIGQPIYWKNSEGFDTIGIVVETLPAKAGVLAITPNDKKNKVIVKEPHKIRDGVACVQVLNHFKDCPEAQDFAGAAIDNHVKVVPKPITKTDDEYKLVWLEAMKSLDEPSVGDRVRLNGMGLEIKNLPNIDETTTPIEKMYVERN